MRGEQSIIVLRTPRSLSARIRSTSRMKWETMGSSFDSINKMKLTRMSRKIKLIIV